MKTESEQDRDLADDGGQASSFEIPKSRMNKHMRMVLDHLWGPTGSVILHIVLVVLLFRLVWDTAGPPSEVEVQLLEMEVREIEEPEEPELDDFEDIDMPDDIMPPEVAMDDRPPDPAEFDRADPDVDVTELQVMPDFQSPLVLRDLFAARTDIGRASMLNRHSGRWGRFTEPAVIKALEWLKNNQRPDGSWETGRAEGQQFVAAVTGLGLMAFLAHGETHTSERYGATVKKAIDYLLAAQRNHGPQGAFTPLGHNGPYVHGIATYAISEAYAMTSIPELRESMDAALVHIIRGQQPSGAFYYSFGQGGARDTSISGWAVQAMKAGLMAGSQVEGLQEAIDKAIVDLRSASLPNGAYAYHDSGPAQCTTAIGTLAMQLSGASRDPTVASAIQWMVENDSECNWDRPERDFPMYNWFYQTQAKFHHGGSVWTNWNNQFAPAFVQAQEDDGHWKSPSHNLDGGHSEHQFGYAFTTSLGALTLQVYYRFLPTFQLDAIPQAPAAEEPGVGDVEIPIDFI